MDNSRVIWTGASNRNRNRNRNRSTSPGYKCKDKKERLEKR